MCKESLLARLFPSLKICGPVFENFKKLWFSNNLRLAQSSLKLVDLSPEVLAMKINFTPDEAAANPIGGAAPAASRILIVDDDAAVREMLARVLAGEGYSVCVAGDEQAALNIVSQTKIDLTLLDLNLPGKSGWNTFKQLTAKNPLLPVIIVTARSNQLFTALGAGVGALLEKPLDFPKLLQTIRELLAEPAASRLARLAGSPADFHYVHGQTLEPKPKKN